MVAARLRLAELVAALSLATDLGLGQSQEHIIRQTLIAMRVAELDGPSDDEREAMFEHCLICADACRRYEQASQAVLAAIG